MPSNKRERWESRQKGSLCYFTCFETMGENIDNKYNINIAPIASPANIDKRRPDEDERSCEREMRKVFVVELASAVSAAKTTIVRKVRPAISAVS